MSKSRLHTVRSNWTRDDKLGDIPTPLYRVLNTDGWEQVGWAAVLTRATLGGLYNRKYLQELWEVYRG